MSPEIKRGPMSPAELMERQTQQIPDEVYIAFNALISQRIMNGRATVLQNEVMSVLERQGMNRREVFKNHWLDVEESYREKGWKVEYDKPGYNESGEAYFVFRTPKGNPKLVQEYN